MPPTATELVGDDPAIHNHRATIHIKTPLRANMTVQYAEADPNNQLLDRALSAITRLGDSLANEHEALR